MGKSKTRGLGDGEKKPDKEMRRQEKVGKETGRRGDTEVRS
jgi:hypothetical protein